MKFLLEEGIVDAVLAVKKGSDLYDAVPTLIKDPEKIIETAGESWLDKPFDEQKGG